MGFLDQLINIAYIVLAVIIVIALVVGALLFYFFKIKKKNRVKEDAVDYSGLQRADAVDYVKFEDIKDDMIIMDGGKRFVGAIKCQGYDFYSAQMDEQAATISGYGNFINVINRPIMYRQYCTAVDMDYTSGRYESVLAGLVREQERYERELMEIENSLRGDLVQADRDLFVKERETVQRKLKALEFRIFHVEDQLRYIRQVSGSNTEPNINETYIFDWTYNEMDFSVELTPEEIHERARQELRATASAFIHSLSGAGVKAKRCSTEDLIEMCRRYSSPISADRYKLRDIVSSSYYEDIVNSSSADDLLAGYAGTKFAEYMTKEMEKSSKEIQAEGGAVNV